MAARKNPRWYEEENPPFIAYLAVIVILPLTLIGIRVFDAAVSLANWIIRPISAGRRDRQNEPASSSRNLRTYKPTRR